MSCKSILCHVCKTINFEQLVAGEIDDDISLGSLLSIHQKRNECPFCDLVVKSAWRRRAADATEPDFYADDGRLIVCAVQSRCNGWSALHNGEERREVVVRFFFSDGDWQSDIIGSTAIARRLASDPDHTGENLFCGRLIPKDHIDFDLINSWISTCTTSHSSVEEYTGCGTRKWETTQNRPHDLKVIDVTNDCVLILPKGQDYIALSYVWGQTPTLMATKENRDALSHSGGLSRAAKKVPIAKTIRDAIILTRSINLQYIWVDSLCITQDDEAEKERLIDGMGTVYMEALITIIAAAGDSASAGLPGVQPKSRKIEQDIARVNPELTLVLPKQSETNIDSSTWNTRGWTFQERLYSKRLLVFLPDRIYWQCRSVLWVEDIIYEHPSAQDNQMMDHRVRLRYLNPDPEWVPELPTNLSSGGQARLFHHPTMDEYYWVVHEYTLRQLTYSDDITRAFAGVLNVLKIALKDFHHGLPISHLDLALLWQPGQALVRRSGLATNFPTWSWMGWVGFVRHRPTRSIQEEASRPLLNWYEIKSDGTLERLCQNWEDTFDHKVQLKYRVGQWKPLIQPEGMYSNPPNIAAFHDLSHVHGGHLAFRSCVANFSLQTAHSAKSDTPGLTCNINSGHHWVGTAVFHGPVSIGSSCDFIVLSEAETSDVPELDKESRRDEGDQFGFFNVLAVDWDSRSQPWGKNDDAGHYDHALLAYRCGLGVMLKKAWAKANVRWTDIILG